MHCSWTGSASQLIGILPLLVCVCSLSSPTFSPLLPSFFFSLLLSCFDSPVHPPIPLLLFLFLVLLFSSPLPSHSSSFSLDFMNMKLVSSLLRRSGAFFLRRTFGSDQLYKLIFTLYTQHLLCSNMAPVEFFIEGTRSRTAKSLHPKLGILSSCTS